MTDHATQQTTTHMTAQSIRAFGGPEAFEKTQLPVPTASAGEVLVRVAFAAPWTGRFAAAPSPP